MSDRIRRCMFRLMTLMALIALAVAPLTACASRGSASTSPQTGNEWELAFASQSLKTPADVDSAYISELSSNITIYREGLVDSPSRAPEAHTMRVRIEAWVRAYQHALAEILRKSDGDEKRRMAAAVGLGFISTPTEAFETSIPLMLKALSDSKWSVRYHALIGFAEMGRTGLTRSYPDRASVLYALATLISHQNAYLREAAVEALGRALKPGEAPDVLDALISRLAEEPEAHIRQVIVMALAEVGDMIGLRAVTAQGLADISTDVRWDAVVALGHSGKDEFIDALMGKLADTDAGVRVQAIAGLKELSKRLKVNDEKRVRIVDAVAECLRDPDSRVRERAILTLGDFADKAATMDLLVKLGESRRKVRLAAVLALGKIRDERAISPLIKSLATRDEEIRDASRASLIAITNVDLGEEAGDWQAWYDAGRPPVQSDTRWQRARIHDTSAPTAPATNTESAADTTPTPDTPTGDSPTETE